MGRFSQPSLFYKGGLAEKIIKIIKDNKRQDKLNYVHTLNISSRSNRSIVVRALTVGGNWPIRPVLVVKII